MLAVIPPGNIDFNKLAKDECFKEPYEYTSIFDDQNDFFLDSNEEIDAYEILEECFEDSCEIFNSKKEIEASLCDLSYGDLFVLGRIWINTLKTALVGAPFKLVSIVDAAAPPPPPEKPPKMRYKDLPIYTTPHYDYKEYINQKEKCPKANTKLLHEYLLPYVTQYRKEAQCQICDYYCRAKDIYKDVYCNVECTKREIIECMRDPDNLQLRQGVAAGSIITGLLIGSTIPRKLFYSGLGGLAAGALCFPAETQDILKSFLYSSTKTFLVVFNKYCTKDWALKEKNCQDVTPQPPVRNSLCPKK